MELKTWRDIEERALVDPILRQAVTLVQRGDITQEQALIHVALALSDALETMRAQLLEEISTRTKPFLFPKTTY